MINPKNFENLKRFIRAPFRSASASILTAAASITVAAVVAALPVAAVAQTAAPQVGQTRVATWKDDKKAPFMMMFDDCAPTHVSLVFPELQKHRMVGTYYIVGNKPERKARLSFWEKEAPASPYAVYGNHTMDHKAFADLASAETDIVGCNELIKRLKPGKNPRLISYATPGGVNHLVSETELKPVLAKHQLILRPAFGGHGGGIAFKTGADILSAVDKAMARGTVEWVIFHGVGGDWLSFDGGEFLNLLDGLETRRADLWITDPISVHKYETERATAAVKVVSQTARSLRLQLTTQADAALYDQPLTLVTRVPDAWKSCRVTQGSLVPAVTVAVIEGQVRYEAVPGAVPIVLDSN